MKSFVNPFTCDEYFRVDFYGSDVITKQYTLTHSCQEIYLARVVWTYHTFKNIFRIKHKFAKYLKESCRLSSDEQLSLKYFQYIIFVKERYPKLSGSCGCHRHERDKLRLTIVVVF